METFEKRHEIMRREAINLIIKEVRLILGLNQDIDYYVLSENHHFILKDGTIERTSTYNKSIKTFLDKYGTAYDLYNGPLEITRTELNI